jgi:hypothetical protein
MIRVFSSALRKFWLCQAWLKLSKPAERDADDEDDEDDCGSDQDGCKKPPLLQEVAPAMPARRHHAPRSDSHAAIVSVL